MAAKSTDACQDGQTDEHNGGSAGRNADHEDINITMPRVTDADFPKVEAPWPAYLK